MKTIKSWSYTRGTVFQQCPQRAYLAYAERIPDPNPSPYAERGTAIHTLAENYVRGDIKTLPEELAEFEETTGGKFALLRQAYADGVVSLEGEWGFDQNWVPCDYAGAWLRVKLDASVKVSETDGIVIDHKTGKKKGEHIDQLHIYALAMFIREPKMKRVKAQLWYLDQHEVVSIDITREFAMDKVLRKNDTLGKSITTATEFPTNANAITCKWCPYKPEPDGTGHCAVGVTNAAAVRNFYKRKNAKTF